MYMFDYMIDGAVRQPDCWVVLRIVPLTIKGPYFLYRILSGWTGGYLSSDAWKLNSGIVSARQDGDYFVFEGKSGNIYKCHKHGYRLNSATNPIYENFKESWQDLINIMPEDTDWINFNWGE